MAQSYACINTENYVYENNQLLKLTNVTLALNSKKHRNITGL